MKLTIFVLALFSFSAFSQSSFLENGVYSFQNSLCGFKLTFNQATSSGRYTYVAHPHNRRECDSEKTHLFSCKNDECFFADSETAKYWKMRILDQKSFIWVNIRNNASGDYLYTKISDEVLPPLYFEAVNTGVKAELALNGLARNLSDQQILDQAKNLLINGVQKETERVALARCEAVWKNGNCEMVDSYMLEYSITRSNTNNVSLLVKWKTLVTSKE